MSDVEPGYTTTEFYLTLVTNLIALLTAFHVVSFTNDQTQAILGMSSLVAVNLIYIIGRSVRKAGAPTVALDIPVPVQPRA